MFEPGGRFDGRAFHREPVARAAGKAARSRGKTDRGLPDAGRRGRGILSTSGVGKSNRSRPSGSFWRPSRTARPSGNDSAESTSRPRGWSIASRWPTPCSISTGCCWCGEARAHRRWACLRIGRAIARLPRSGFDDDIAVLSPPRPDGDAGDALSAREAALRRRRRPSLRRRPDALLVDRHARPLAGLRDPRRRLGLAPVDAGRSEPDVDNYDACYLPDGDIIFSSTASMAAVPCVNGSTRWPTSTGWTPTARNIRQLCFDQEHNWCPTVLPNGRVLYLRWEYTDTPHTPRPRAVSHEPRRHRPDGVLRQQFVLAERDVLRAADSRPSDPVRRRSSAATTACRAWASWCCSTPAKGRREADGVVQRIPGHGKQGRAAHRRQSGRRNLAEVPASRSRSSDKYFLVACQADARGALGHLPGRRVRQHGAAARGARLRAAGADSAAQDARRRR